MYDTLLFIVVLNDIELLTNTIVPTRPLFTEQRRNGEFSSLYLLNVLCGIVDIGFNMIFYVLYCLWMPPQVQDILLLTLFASVFPLLGDSPPLSTFESLSFDLEYSGQWLFS